MKISDYFDINELVETSEDGLVRKYSITFKEELPEEITSFVAGTLVSDESEVWYPIFGEVVKEEDMMDLLEFHALSIAKDTGVMVLDRELSDSILYNENGFLYYTDRYLYVAKFYNKKEVVYLRDVKESVEEILSQMGVEDRNTLYLYSSKPFSE